MNTVGLLIHSTLPKVDEVCEKIVDLGGEIHNRTEEGKLIVTIEEESDQILSEKLVKCQNLKGVQYVAVAYHENFDAEEDK